MKFTCALIKYIKTASFNIVFVIMFVGLVPHLWFIEIGSVKYFEKVCATSQFTSNLIIPLSV